VILYLSSSNFFLTQENYHSLLNSCGFKFDSSIPFLVFVFYTKTHHLSPSQYNVPLSKDRKKLHNEIFNLYNQGLGYKRIHRKLVENGWKVQNE